MNEFKDQLDTADKEKVSKLLVELRELAVKGQAADPSVTAEIIKEKIDATQNASLGLFQKVYTRHLLHIDGSMLTSLCRSTRRGMLRTTRRKLKDHRRALRVTRTRRRRIKHPCVIVSLGRTLSALSSHRRPFASVPFTYHIH